MIDYKKKYLDALERANSFQEKYGGDYAGYIFPELRESEDERIRKRLIEYFEGFRMGNVEVRWEGLIVQEVLAWLEKQKDKMTADEFENSDLFQLKLKTQYHNGYQDGMVQQEEKQKEQKIPDCCLKCNEYEIGYKAGYEHGCTAGYNKAMKEVDEQKEQKPADDKAFEEWIDGWFKEHKEKAYPQITMDEKEFKYFCRGIRNMYQQKPEWSERDEKILASAMSHIADSQCFDHFHDISKDDIYDWLKSLRPQPKQEWSEEDESKLNHILEIVHIASGREVSVDEKEELESFLKSLHPQPKQGWSGEDSDNLERVDNYLWMLDNYVGNDCATPQGKTDKIRGNIQEVLSPWLKSLPERFNLQPKQEWSEEDERILKGIIGLIDHDQHYGVSNKEMLDWLKSLRPQYHGDVTMTEAYKMGLEAGKLSSWKPSEEQMERLFSIVAALRKDYCDDMANFLANLYTDLKKLGVKDEPEYYQHFDPDC